MAKRNEEVIDFKIHLPEYSAPAHQPTMMFDHANMRNRIYELEAAVADGLTCQSLLEAEVVSNRRMINEMQKQLEVLAKGV